MQVSRPVGDILREWRQRRRISQLDLALDADVSAKHVSFVETGRAQPSREMILRFAEHLQVPLRDRNVLLTAGGYAAMYPSARSMIPRSRRHGARSISCCADTSRTRPSRSIVTGRSSRRTMRSLRSPRGSRRHSCSRRATCCGSASIPTASPHASSTTASGART